MCFKWVKLLPSGVNIQMNLSLSNKFSPVNHLRFVSLKYFRS